MNALEIPTAFLPRAIRTLMKNLKRIEASIRQNGERSADDLIEAGKLYEEFLQFVIKHGETTEAYRRSSRPSRIRNKDIEVDENEPPSTTEWLASFASRSEPDNLPSPDEMQDYIRQMIYILDVEVRLREKYNVERLKARPVQHLRDVLDMFISQLNIPSRIKLIGGGPVRMTEAIAGITQIINSLGSNIDELLPLYPDEDAAAADADRMIAEMMAENGE
ncbi:uncharacterized protein TRUGW13939_00324 [Talaromyces rugulosus]|uniref:Uncharacterized protein n=1 Tax=Talaromyces rugulosus TaxID=121627 RepID=A0A7H8QH35_TALRU|nr:uncharacterized protein TRUGW13939_00324 [Talaromyces rugulosus]QKX53248.1 hypothetical protein TRUGW13939_00324 [Talaromyces rugulosus]